MSAHEVKRYTSIVWVDANGEFLVISEVATHTGTHTNISFTTDINKAYNWHILPYGTRSGYNLKALSVIIETTKKVEIVDEPVDLQSYKFKERKYL